MKPKIFKIFFLLSISGLAFIFISDQSKSCGYFPDPDDYYTIFSHDLMKVPPLLKPFFLSENHFYTRGDSTSLNPETDNLNSWHNYFNDKPFITDIRKIIYPSDLQDLKNIFSFLDNKIDTLNKKWSGNSLISYWEKNKYKEALNYLIFAKKCEPYVISHNYWSEIKRDTTGMSKLTEEGLKLYSDCTNKFIKQRYAYQVIRLEHYSYHFKKTVNLYDTFFGNDTSHNLIKYWALSHKAGALQSLGKIAESNYLFSRIFDKCPSKKLIASDGYKTISDSSFHASLDFCKNDHERESLWMLSAYKDGDLEAMKHIYKLEPSSPYLLLLLSREIDRVERNVLPSTNYYYKSINTYNYSYNYYVSQNKRWSYSNTYFSDYDKEYLKIIKEIADNNNTPDVYLWNLAAGYLSTLMGKTDEAVKYYDGAEHNQPLGDSLFKDRIKIFRIINEVTALNKITPDTEGRILNDLKWLNSYKGLKADTAFLFVRYILANKYAQNHNYIRMHLCIGSNDFGYDLRDITKEPLDDLITFYNKPNKTGYEKFLLSIYSKKKQDLLALKGTLLLQRHKFNEAVKCFEEAGFSRTLQADPFVIHINDCHDCDIENKGKKEYTQLSFIKKILELDSLANTNKNEADKYYFLIANGYYNITYYGNCWDASSYDREFNFWGYYKEQPWEFYDCSIAKSYYEKVINTTKNRELAAKSTFMAAKCEQNEYYNNYADFHDYRTIKDTTVKKENYRTFFKLLKEKYSDTQFYNEALKECKYFNEFTKKD